MLKDQIYILLKRQNKTLKDLCSYIGISDTGLRKIFVRDSCEISLLKKIANFFNVPITYFFETGNKVVASGDFSAASVLGDASVDASSDAAVLHERIKSLEQLITEKDRMIEEKERTIKILLNRK